MAANFGNQDWKKRREHGRKRIFETAEALTIACYEYFKEIANNPIQEKVLFHSTGTITEADKPLLRAMTLKGLCNHLGITLRTWENYRGRQEFTEECEYIEQIIYQQKFEGAAAGLLNPVIIARDLGLADNQKHEHGGNLNINIVKFGNDNKSAE